MHCRAAPRHEPLRRAAAACWGSRWRCEHAAAAGGGGRWQRRGENAVRFSYPSYPFDHLGRTGGAKDEAGFANLADLLALARYPNVAIKATGAPSYSSAPYPYRNIHPYLRQIYDAFGPERMFWGTDITRMPCSWKQCVTMFTEELSWLSVRDKDLIMGRALCNWLDWQLP